MSKRQRSSAVTPPSKRSKKAHAFGGPSADDGDPLTAQLTAPSSTSLSTRTLLPDHVPALTTLCARVFVTNMESLFQRNREETQEWLKALPEAIIPPLFSMLRTRHPSLLSHPFISTFFLRGDQVVLSSSLPGVTSATVQAISNLGVNLRNLQLIGLDKISDEVFAKLLINVTALEVLVLRGCTKVNRKAVKAASMSYKTLKNINLNYTSAPIAAISLLTAECLELEVLKLAGVTGITDTSLGQILHADAEFDRRPIAELRSLKLRHTLISEHALNVVFRLCPHLSRLDVSFTPIRHPTLTLNSTADIKLRKLSLTSTPLRSLFLQNLSPCNVSNSILFTLRTLHIGALGSSPSSSVSTLPGLLTLTDNNLVSLTRVLVQCKLLENISLVGNAKLGLRSGKNSALRRFLYKVGRRCKVLNLAGIPRLKSSDLAGLLPLHEQETEGLDSASDVDDYLEGPSPLQTLILNNTDVGDNASRYIAACEELQTLELAGTKFGYHSLFQILDACPRLTSLDLTSCRGVKVGDRRRFFEVWEREWKDN